MSNGSNNTVLTELVQKLRMISIKHLSSHLALCRWAIIFLCPLRFVLIAFWNYLHLAHLNPISTTLQTSIVYLFHLPLFWSKATVVFLGSNKTWFFFSNTIRQNKFQKKFFKRTESWKLLSFFKHFVPRVADKINFPLINLRCLLRTADLGENVPFYVLAYHILTVSG